MATKLTLTPAQKVREARLNALLNGRQAPSGPGRVLPDVPPIKLKTTHIPDRMALREARAEAKAS